MESQASTVWLVPGSDLVLFLVRLEQGPIVWLQTVPPRFLDGLRAATALLSFSTLQRADTPLDELLPWAGNV